MNEQETYICEVGRATDAYNWNDRFLQTMPATIAMAK